MTVYLVCISVMFRLLVTTGESQIVLVNKPDSGDQLVRSKLRAVNGVPIDMLPYTVFIVPYSPSRGDPLKFTSLKPTINVFFYQLDCVLLTSTPTPTLNLPLTVMQIQ